MLNRILRTGVAAAVILSALATPVTAAESERESANAALTNPLLYAIAWRQTAAEFRALYYQGFALAQLRVEQALAAREASASNDTRPLAVITDVDETVLLSGAYWGQLIAEGGDFFDDATWDAWVPNNAYTLFKLTKCHCYNGPNNKNCYYVSKLHTIIIYDYRYFSQ